MQGTVGSQHPPWAARGASHLDRQRQWAARAATGRQTLFLGVSFVICKHRAKWLGPH